MASKRNGGTSKKTSATTQPGAVAQASPLKAVAPATPLKASGQAPQMTSAQPAPVAPPRAAAPQSHAAAARTGAPQAGNLAVEWKARYDGSGEVVVVYQGALAMKDSVLARTGTWRSGGQPWTEIQDVRLTRDAPGRYVGAIPVPAGAPLEAVELAFHAGGDWDNGGRAPLGYYEWSVRERQLVVR